MLTLSDSSSDELVTSLNQQRRSIPRWPFAAVGFAIVALLLHGGLSTFPQGARLVVWLLWAAATAWAYWRDKLRRLTVLFYEPDGETTARFDVVCSAFAAGAISQRIQSITFRARTDDPKYSYGADSGVKLDSARLLLGQGPGVEANVAVPVLQTGRTTLALYPDRVLAFQGRHVGAISYEQLEVESKPAKVVETEDKPGDAKVVGSRWRYVNCHDLQPRRTEVVVVGSPASTQCPRPFGVSLCRKMLPATSMD